MLFRLLEDYNLKNPRTPADLVEYRSPLVPKSFHVGTYKAKIENGNIVWEDTGFAAKDPLRVSDFRVLQEFAALGNRTDEQLLRFAQRYGPLRLCKHGFAFGHRGKDFTTRCYESDDRGDDLAPGQSVRLIWSASESVEAWRRYVRRAKGIVTIAANLRQDPPVEVNDWSWIADGIPSTHLRHPLGPLLALSKEDPLVAVLATQPHGTHEEQRRTLSLAVNHWLDECEIGISIEWPQSGIDFRIGRSDPHGRGSSLLIVIGVQLLRAVLRQKSFVWCSECGSPYVPKRWPRVGQRHYCEQCGRSAVLRNSQRKFREKSKSDLGKKEQQNEQTRQE